MKTVRVSSPKGQISEREECFRERGKRVALTERERERVCVLLIHIVRFK